MRVRVRVRVRGELEISLATLRKKESKKIGFAVSFEFGTLDHYFIVLFFHSVRLHREWTILIAMAST